MNEIDKYLKLYKERFNKDFVYNLQFDNSDSNIIKIINECLEQNIEAEQYYSKYNVTNSNDALELISKMTNISLNEIENYAHCIDNEPNLLYISIPTKKDSFIIDKYSLEFLYVNSSVSPDKHLEEYKKGNRSKKEDFNN